MKLFIKLALVIGFGLAVPWLNAQYKESVYEDMCRLYPGHNYIQLAQKNRYSIEENEGELQITEHSTEIYMVLKGTFGNVFSQSVYSSEFFELNEVEAYAYHLDGKKYKRNRIQEFHEKMNVDGDSFYDDQKETVISFPSVKAGSIMEIHTSHTLKEPRFMGSDFLASFNPVHELELVFDCDRGVEMDFLFMNAEKEKLNLEKNESGSRKTYAYRSNKVGSYKVDESSPNIRYYVPHLIPIIRSYQVEDETVEVLNDVGSLYKWYYPFIKDFVENEVPAEIRYLSDSLIRDCNSEIEKVTTLYQWVQEHIKYIAFEYGLGGFVPRPSDEVLQNRYGDCKDKTSILYALMKAADIPAYFTWIGTTHLPYTYKQVPTPLADNHMILSYHDGKHYYYLDGTGEHQPLEYPTSFIQGKEALIALSADRYDVQTVPVPDVNHNLYCDSTWFRIEGNVISGHGHMQLKGYPRINFKRSHHTMIPDKQEAHVEDLVRKGNNKFILNKYVIAPDQPYDPQMDIAYSYDLGSWVSSMDGELYINMNLYRPLSSLLPKEGSVHPIELGFKRSYENHFCLEIPEGYELSMLPDEHRFQADGFSGHIRYELVDGAIWYHQSIAVNTLFIQPEELSAWTGFIKDLEKTYRTSIILTANE
ncbi:MAG: DUF3857 domain-containing protein [Bacteroidota bacterium]